jgi:membrane protease YdiL (CAAX protease family)
MEAKEIQIKALILSIASIIVIEVAHMVAVSKGLSYPLVILGAARFLEIVLITLIFLILGKGITSIGLGLDTMATGLKKGLIWSVCFGVIVASACLLLSVLGINPLPLIRTYLPQRPGEITLFFFVGGVVSPIAEEVFVRGVLYGVLRRGGVVVALVISTLVFVLIHPMKSGFPVTQAVGGIVFALAYEMGGSLIVPIIIHALGNIAIFTLSLLY